MGTETCGANWAEFFSDDAFLRDVCAEVVRQDDNHPAGYPPTRDGVFLGIKTAVHELDVEALAAWDAEKRTARWERTRGEVVQAAAVLLRLVRDIDNPRPREADGG